MVTIRSSGVYHFGVIADIGSTSLVSYKPVYWVRRHKSVAGYFEEEIRFPTLKELIREANKHG